MAVAEKARCAWCLGSDAYKAYHDEEWGRPQHDDAVLFEFLILEGAQAGLSWSTILNKRDGYRRVFDHFDAKRLAKWDESQLEAALLDPGIVRNRLKVWSVRTNALAFLKVQKEFGSFDAYLWKWVDGAPLLNAWSELKQVPARTEISDALSKDLLKRGFKFVGSTIVYAYMQAMGLVNDHMLSCHRYPKPRARRAPGV